METNKEYNEPGAVYVPHKHTESEMNAVEMIELASEAEAIHFFKTIGWVLTLISLLNFTLITYILN